MTSVQSQEDLEARIERIRKRDEELEKKHREAEADRLMAMKENAMVEIKPPKDDDWPREHKYDKIDFTYDLDAQALAELEEKKKEKNAFIQKIAKDYKVFAEGEGPPPDPAYSFLADVERDGEKAVPANATPGGVGIKGNKNNFDRKNPNNRSGRMAGGIPAGGSIRGGGRGGGPGGKPGGYNGNLQRSLSTNEHDGRRPEHMRHGGGPGGHKLNGGGPGDGKWRRDWDHDRSKDDCCIHNQSNGFKGEPNLTVSVSQDGEFKSVKVTSPPIIGSGRVGPRQPAKPQFQFQTGGNQFPMDHYAAHHQNNYPHGHPQHQHQHQQQGGKPHHQHHHHHRNNNENFNRNASGRKSDKEAKRAPKPGQSTTAAMASSNKAAPAAGSGGSVQDRLNRNRAVNIDKNDNTIKITTNGGGGEAGTHKANATLKTISKIIEKNAEIDEKLARQMHQENERMASRMKELRMQDGA